MASQVNRDFFKKAKKVDRAIELRDNEAVIPAVKERAEVRARLPNRRLLSVEERAAIIQERNASVSALEEEIEVERKVLLSAVKAYESTNSGASDVVSQNLKIKSLMERRSALSRPQRWIESISGLTYKDVFASKRDTRKLFGGEDVFQIKHRLEPITSLYVDLEPTSAATATAATATAATATAGTAKSLVATLASIATAVAAPAAPAPSAAEAAQGVIIGQKRVIKTKKAAAAAPAAPATFGP
jgi:hypothetical protein